MENLDLLSELVNLLEKEKVVFDRELASLQKKQAELTRQQEEISKQIRTKERETITQEKIDKYKAFWKSLSANNAPPCPLCFLFHDKQSDLQAVPETHNKEHFRCRECGMWFHVSLP